MDVPSTLRYYHDKAYRDALHKEVNAITQRIRGAGLFQRGHLGAQPKRIENLFGCEFSYREDSTPWLTPVTGDPDEFARVLDRAEAIDVRSWALPEPYLEEWEQRKAAGKPLPKLGGGSRGPATIMTSVLDTETLFYWLYDHPDLMRRFRDILAREDDRVEHGPARIQRQRAAGLVYPRRQQRPLQPPLYREFCFPVLQRVMDAMAPGDARRDQHSDSAMGHLIEKQYELGIRNVNYGPTVDAGLIREKMPDALIRGQMPPFMLRNGSPDEIKARVIDDFEKAGPTGGLDHAPPARSPRAPAWGGCAG